MHFIQISDLCLCDFLNLIVGYKKCNIIITFLTRISMSVFVSLCCILTLYYLGYFALVKKLAQVEKQSHSY